METLKLYVRRMLLSVWFGSQDVAQGQIDVMQYVSTIQGFRTRRFDPENFLGNGTVTKISSMTIGEETIDVLKHITNILIAPSDQIIAPSQRLLPEYVDFADIRVYHVSVIDAGGAICCRLYDAAHNIVAMIEVGETPLVKFYQDGGAKTLTVSGDRNVVVFVRF